MVEYGLIVALIAIAAIVALSALGTELSATLDNIQTELDTANQVNA